MDHQYMEDIMKQDEQAEPEGRQQVDMEADADDQELPGVDVEEGGHHLQPEYDDEQPEGARPQDEGLEEGVSQDEEGFEEVHGDQDPRAMALEGEEEETEIEEDNDEAPQFDDDYPQAQYAGGQLAGGEGTAQEMQAYQDQLYMQQMEAASAMKKGRRRKKRKSRPSTAKYNWKPHALRPAGQPGGRRPMSASTRKKGKKNKRRRNSAKSKAQTRKKSAQQSYIQQMQENQLM